MEAPLAHRRLFRPRPVAWLRAHASAADLFLAAVITALAVTSHLVDFDGAEMDSRSPSWWTVPIVVGATFPIAWRRRRPDIAAIVVATFEIVASFLDVGGTGFLGVVISLYSVGAHMSGLRRTRVVTTIGLGVLVLFVAGLIVGELDAGSAIASTIVLVTAFVLGDNLRRRRETALAVLDRAERAEREQELIAERKVNAERSRIARELHDVVAHSVSVMVIQAAAARRSLSNSPENAERALSNIEETGRRTMNELRGILGVLRRNDPLDHAFGLEPQPTLRDVVALVEPADDLPIVLDLRGDLDDVPSSVALIGFRVVQEALTNVRRHAGPVTRVDVAVERTAGRVAIRVTDDGRGAAADDIGPGYGTVGMRERVAAIGGTVASGSRPGGGWSVSADLPLDSRLPVAPGRTVTPESAVS